MKALRINNISKKYRINFRKTLVALDKVSFQLFPGEIIGLIGHNGAGKTTLMKILLGIVKPTTGFFEFIGFNNEFKIGYVPDCLNYDLFLTPAQFINFNKKERDKTTVFKEKMNQLSKLFELDLETNNKIGNLSKGTKQKLLIIQALLGLPEILILDEPNEGLDPINRQVLRSKLIEAKNHGSIVLISSHVLSEMELLCDRFIILKNGQLKGEINKAEINGQAEEYNLCISKEHYFSNLKIFNSYSFIENGDRVYITVAKSNYLKELINLIDVYGIKIISIQSKVEGLESIYNRLVNSNDNI